LHDTRAALRRSYGTADIPAWAERIGLSAEAVETIRKTRYIRNQIVHGIEMPNRQFLIAATRRLLSVLSELENHTDESVRTAYLAARQGLGDSL
jgi:hypothetical protein